MFELPVMQQEYVHIGIEDYYYNVLSKSCLFQALLHTYILLKELIKY